MHASIDIIFLVWQGHGMAIRRDGTASGLSLR